MGTPASCSVGIVSSLFFTILPSAHSPSLKGDGPHAGSNHIHLHVLRADPSREGPECFIKEVLR